MSGKRRPRARWSNTPPPPRAEGEPTDAGDEAGTDRREESRAPEKAPPRSPSEAARARLEENRYDDINDDMPDSAALAPPRAPVLPPVMKVEERPPAPRPIERAEPTTLQADAEAESDSDRDSQSESDSDSEDDESDSESESEEESETDEESESDDDEAESESDLKPKIRAVPPEIAQLRVAAHLEQEAHHDRFADDAPAPEIPRGAAPSWFLRIALLIAVAIVTTALVRYRFARHVEPPRAVVEPPVATASAPLPVPITFAPTAAVEPTPPEDDASVVDLARYERIEAVRALEKRAVPHALELAQQAVEHDPSEAEGWLILGAAHLYRGDGRAARAAFKSCVEQAKTGRRDECAALLY